MDAHWQVQEAKQRFSELVRRAHAEGAQFVTRHGEEVAVVLDIAEYRKLSGHDPDLKDYLVAMPKGDDLVIDRAGDLTREIDLGTR
jgi:prevent-host-death family protein